MKQPIFYYEGNVRKVYWPERLGANPTQEQYDAARMEAEKSLKAEYIRTQFEDATLNGANISLGWKMDCRREDIDNLSRLREFMIASNQADTIIRDYGNQYHQVTIEQLGVIIIELIGFGLAAFQKKWSLESALSVATTIKDIEDIVW